MNITNLMQTCKQDAFAQIKKNVLNEAVTQTVTEFPKTANDCITGIQQGLIRTQKTFPKLRKYSCATDYFGVTDEAGIQRRYENQMALSWLKIREQNLVNFPPIVLSGKKDEKKVQKALDKLNDRGFGRLTITDKLFGNGIKDGTHTVGLVYHKGKYYVLDSIPETYAGIKDCHERLIKFLDLNPKDVVFPNKPQQSMDEYTCNNWAHANIEAVMGYLKNSPEKELTPEVFDEILPRDINKILSDQYMLTVNKLKGRDLSELIAEHYNKTHLYVGL